MFFQNTYNFDPEILPLWLYAMKIIHNMEKNFLRKDVQGEAVVII